MDREKRRDKMSLIKGKTVIKSVIVWITMIALLMGYRTLVMANDSPDVDYETDSAYILVSEADTSVADIAALVEGDSPVEVLGDDTLEGYSTLAVFSITAIGGYDFSTIETTVIKGATITEDMDIQVRFLPDGGSWEKINYTLSNGTIACKFEDEGNLAIFVKDEEDTEEVSTSDADGTSSADSAKADTYKKAPQTGDNLPIYVLVGLLSMGALAVSVRKLVKK
jgi:LPXTG-motif cell wall-anchored protein